MRIMRIRRGVLAALILTIVTLLGCGGGGGSADSGSLPPPTPTNLDFLGSYPTPSVITYTQEDGTSVDVTAYPGQVEVFFDTTTPAATAIQAIESLGAEILAQMPDYGYYLVAVPTGSEATFISSILKNAAVLDAFPHAFSTPAIATVNGNTALITEPFPVPTGVSSTVIDCFSGGATHGETVVQSDQGNGGTVGLQVDVGCSNISDHSVGKSIVLANAGNNKINPDGPLLINISSAAGPNNHDIADDCVSVPAGSVCPAELQALLDWKAVVKSRLWFIRALPAAQRKNVVVTIALGNGSMDVSPALDVLRTESPALVEVLENNVILVGAANDRVTHDLRASGTYSNTAANGERDVVNFSGLINSGTGALIDAGTSFASPRVEAIAEQVIKAVPGITVTQVVQAIKRADELPGGLTLAGATEQAQSIKDLGVSGAAIGISGQVTDSKTGAAIGGAKLLIMATDGTFMNFSSATGAYALKVPVSLRDQTSSAIMQASHNGYIPQAVPVNFPSGTTLDATVNVALEPIGNDTVIVGTNLHHLGDSSFSTPLNAGLQLLTAEGTSLTRAFTVDASQLPPTFTKATLEYAVNGAECSDPVTLNGTQIASLNNTVAGAQTLSTPFDIALLNNGANTLSVSSAPSCGVGMVGVDDFEISNISIRLSN